MSDDSPPTLKRGTALRTSLLFAGLYAVFSVAYVHLSDALVATLAKGDPATIHTLQTYKGTAFVLLSALLLFAAVYAGLARAVSSSQAQHEALDRARRAVDGIRRLNTRLNATVDFLPDATFVINNQGCITAWNRATEALTGVSKEQMVGRGDQEYALPFYGERRPMLIDLVEKPIEEARQYYPNAQRVGDSITAENYTPHMPGITYLWGIAAPLRDSDGNITGAIESIRDITKRRQTEQEIADSELRYRLVFEGASDGIAVADAETGLITQVNRRLAQMLQQTPEQLIGRKTSELHPHEQRESAQEAFRSCVESGGFTGIQMTMLAADGTPVYVSGNASLLEIHGRRYVMGIFRDVGEQRRADEEKSRLEAQLAQAQKMEAIGQLAAGIAHDFNNLLGGILGYSDLLRLKLADQPQLRGYAEEVVHVAGQATELINKLLAFSRKSRSVTQPFDLNEVIGALGRILERTVDRKVQVILALDARRSQVTGDRVQMQNALLNLCLNARDAMPDGGTLTIRTTDCDAAEVPIEPTEAGEADWVRIDVADTGSGIPEEIRAHIFEPFFTTKSGKGTGLGLSSTYQHVRAHKGRIEVESRMGEGSTFRIWLPATEPVQSADARTDSAIIRGTGRVLVVDDEAVVLRAIQGMLEEARYTVTAQLDAEQAVAYLAAHAQEVDLVVMDLSMPRMDGQTCFRQMREYAPHLRCLFISGHQPENLAKDLAVPGTAFLRKPFTAQALTESIRDLLIRNA